MRLPVKIFWCLLNFLLTAAAVCAAAVILLYVLGFHPNIVVSGSMEPVIQTGAVAFVNVRDRDVSINDIVEYKITQDNGRETYVVHRVIGTENGNFITKGDANDERDAHEVMPSQIVGKYKFSIPGAGRISIRLRNVIFGGYIFLYVFTAILMKLTDEEEEGKVKASGGKARYRL